MAKTVEYVRVTLASDNFYPQAFRWAGRNIRVLFVEGLRTSGVERLYRVRTIEGAYELIQHTAAQTWQVRRQPSWWERVMGQGISAARYTPANSRGRVSRAQARAKAQQRAALQQTGVGGKHASGFAVVR